MHDMNDNPNPNGKAVKIGKLEEHMRFVEKALKRIENSLMNDYVRKEEFEPVKKVVYRGVTIILSAVVTAIVALVIINPF